MARYPNLYLVGAPKCGTTSMAYYLGQHPSIYTPYMKEPTFFASDLKTRGRRLDTETYLRLYEGWTTELFALDASAHYLASSDAPKNIYQCAPGAKILAMVRNPVDAVYSLYWQNRYDMAEDLQTFEESVAAESERIASNEIPEIGSLDRKLYSKLLAFTANIKRYSEIFSADNVKVVVFDDLVDDTIGCISDVCEFLGVSNKFDFSVEPKNPAAMPKSTAVANFVLNPPRILKTAARAMLPLKSRFAVRSAILSANTRVEPYPPMARETRRNLIARFAEEVDRLSSLLDRDLGHWLQLDG